MRLDRLAWACITALISAAGCDTHCISEAGPLWEAGPSEYRLELTNRSSHMVELWVDGESLGVFCDGVIRLPVGNFPRSPCSRIRVDYFDNPGSMALDDCLDEGEAACESNNVGGRVCYDTTLSGRVEARFD